ncbi:hypothetical protein Y888_03625 [Mixta calida B021323]|nr:hypothetical protein Y888_03625 [Mixta calida B021323]
MLRKAYALNGILRLYEAGYVQLRYRQTSRVFSGSAPLTHAPVLLTKLGLLFLNIY